MGMHRALRVRAECVRYLARNIHHLARGQYEDRRELFLVVVIIHTQPLHRVVIQGSCYHSWTQDRVGGRV